MRSSRSSRSSPSRPSARTTQALSRNPARFSARCSTRRRGCGARGGLCETPRIPRGIPDDLTKRYLAKTRRPPPGRRPPPQTAPHDHRRSLRGDHRHRPGGGVHPLARTNADQWARGINDAVALHTLEGLQQAHKSVDELKASHPKLLDQPSVAKALSALQVAQQQYDGDAAGVKRAADQLDAAPGGGAERGPRRRLDGGDSRRRREPRRGAQRGQ